MNVLDVVAEVLADTRSLAAEPCTVAAISEYRGGWVFDITSQGGRAKGLDRVGPFADQSIFVPRGSAGHDLVARGDHLDLYGPALGFVNLMPPPPGTHPMAGFDGDQRWMTPSGYECRVHTVTTHGEAGRLELVEFVAPVPPKEELILVAQQAMSHTLAPPYRDFSGMRWSNPLQPLHRVHQQELDSKLEAAVLFCQPGGAGQYWVNYLPADNFGLAQICDRVCRSEATVKLTYLRLRDQMLLVETEDGFVVVHWSTLGDEFFPTNGPDSAYGQDPFHEMLSQTAVDRTLTQVDSIRENNAAWTISYAPEVWGAEPPVLQIPRAWGNAHFDWAPRGTVYLDPGSNAAAVSGRRQPNTAGTHPENPNVRLGPSGHQSVVHEADSADEGQCSAYYIEFPNPQPGYDQLGVAVTEALQWDTTYIEDSLRDTSIGDLDTAARDFYVANLEACLLYAVHSGQPVAAYRYGEYYVNDERRHGGIPPDQLARLRAATRGRVVYQESLAIMIVFEIDDTLSVGYWESFA